MKHLATLVAAALVALVPGAARSEQGDKASWWQRLVMPGELSAAHADLEGDCSTCHKSFDLEAEATLCLDCHEPVAEDLSAKRGFHGLSSGPTGSDCRTCHSEHEGAAFDILGLRPADFDHEVTDFPLRGAHARTDCADCHEPEAKHRDAPTDCVACHEPDDAHGGSLGTDCATCHEASLRGPSAGWAGATFDHAATDFPLTGAHDGAACRLCHSSPAFDAASPDCVACHASDDAHAGELGNDCGSCHGTRTWTTSRFDHEKASGFALVGSHADAACGSCHREPPEEVELPTDCGSCHRLDDAHRGAYGPDCGDCHNANHWQNARFDHVRETGFALRGAHESLSCPSCHTVSLFEPELETGCGGCHARDDPHAAQLGTDCGACHGDRQFATGIAFDHEITSFPLLGLHAMLGCEECHATTRFKDADTDCAACHAAEDVHRNALGQDCADCHNPNGWRIWRFDHEARTGLALEGSHEGLRCAACHVPGSSGPDVPSTCESCHTRDDRHGGSFGRDCALCHGTDSWIPARMGRARGRSWR